MMTWPARRVGDRILCGRPAPDGGCRGEIATVGRMVHEDNGPDDPDRGRIEDRIVLPRGLTEDPPGSARWRWTARASRARAAGRRPDPRFRNPEEDAPQAQRESLTGHRAPRLPLWRQCPVCNVLAEVSPDMLTS